jgi:hypothetical protein
MRPTCSFLADPRISPTSYQAERDLRPAKQQKISGEETSVNHPSQRLSIVSGDFDALHVAASGRGLSSRLRAEAFGDEYPVEVDPSSSCTWSVLGEMVKALRLRPDDVLVDLGCGRGGTGLWLARAF